MRSTLALLFLALLTACGVSSDVRHVAPSLPPPARAQVVDVRIDAAAPELEEVEIRGALADWNDAFGGTLRLRPLASAITPADMQAPGKLIMRVDGTCTHIPVVTYGGPVLAWVNVIGGDRAWFVHERIPLSHLRAVIRHELGHMFGALDREGPGLMHKTFDAQQTTCIDGATAREVASYLRLPVGAFGYCAL